MELRPVHTDDYSPRIRRQSPFSVTVAEFAVWTGLYKDGVHLGVRNATPAPESHEDLGDFVSCMNCGEYLKEDA